MAALARVLTCLGGFEPRDLPELRSRLAMALIERQGGLAGEACDGSDLARQLGRAHRAVSRE